MKQEFLIVRTRDDAVIRRIRTRNVRQAIDFASSKYDFSVKVCKADQSAVTGPTRQVAKPSHHT